jgi:tetratricopeptide (TPR) repeat protein
MPPSSSRVRARRSRDPLESAIEAALDPGRFVSERACYAFVSGLDEVAGELARLVESEPQRAAALYEAFVAGCPEKANEVDDSSGDQGMFVAGLFQGWIRARQAMGASADETAARLLRWMDDDQFGFTLTLPADAAGVLDRAGLAAFAGQVRARFEAGRAAGARGRWDDVLRALLLAQKDVEAYARLAEDTGVTRDDCHAMATMLVGRRRAEDALTWIDRGLALDERRGGSRAEIRLAELKGRVLKKLGREEEALDAAWARYREHPSRYRYDDLLEFVPKAERPAWHEKAVEAATETDLYSLVELLVHTREIDRLGQLIARTPDGALEGVSHFALEPAARKLDRRFPAEAARLWRALAVRILEQGKSRYYGAALEHMERAKKSSLKAGRQDIWGGSCRRFVSDIAGRAGSCPRSRGSRADRSPDRSPASSSGRKRGGTRHDEPGRQPLLRLRQAPRRGPSGRSRALRRLCRPAAGVGYRLAGAGPGPSGRDHCRSGWAAPSDRLPDHAHARRDHGHGRGDRRRARRGLPGRAHDRPRRRPGRSARSPSRRRSLRPSAISTCSPTSGTVGAWRRTRWRDGSSRMPPAMDRRGSWSMVAS